VSPEDHEEKGSGSVNIQDLLDSSVRTLRKGLSEDSSRVITADVPTEEADPSLVAFLVQSLGAVMLVAATSHAAAREAAKPFSILGRQVTTTTPLDLARVGIAQRMVRAVLVTSSLLQAHFYVEALAASRPLLEGRLLLRYFGQFPREVADWFEAPDEFATLKDVRGRLRIGPDDLYHLLSEAGSHVTAASTLAGAVAPDGRTVQFTMPGATHDESLHELSNGILLASAAFASDEIVDVIATLAPKVAQPSTQFDLVQALANGTYWSGPTSGALQFWEGDSVGGPNREDLRRKFRDQLKRIEIKAMRVRSLSRLN
jgi:hypothetical protein